MDEPGSAWDPIATAKIGRADHQLKQNYTIVIVTHNMQQAARVIGRDGFFFLLGELIGVRAYEANLHQSPGQTHERLHHREIRIMERHFDQMIYSS